MHLAVNIINKKLFLYFYLKDQHFFYYFAKKNEIKYNTNASRAGISINTK